MKNRALLLVAASGVVLFGCAALDPTRSAPCSNQVCLVKINIVSCTKGGGGISAYPDPAHIGRGAHEIHFDISSTGYEFTANGITFKKPPGAVFSDPRKLTATKFKWHDNNAAPGTYDYNIEVVSASGSICRYDPTIVND
jgi:hypothetical protein